MPIVYITGAAGSGKTSALDAIHEACLEAFRPVVHVMGSSSPEAIRKAMAGRSGTTLLVDECPPALLHWLEHPRNLPRDCRVFVTLALGIPAIVADERERLVTRAERAESILATLVVLTNRDDRDAARQGAPNHCHRIAGQWDSDGQKCHLCAAWNQARELSRDVTRKAREELRAYSASLTPEQRAEHARIAAKPEEVARLELARRFALDVIPGDDAVPLMVCRTETLTQGLDVLPGGDVVVEAVKPRWCETMERPAEQCGCTDCGSSLVQVVE